MRILFITISLLSILSCNPQPLFEKGLEIEKDWNYDEALVLDVEVVSQETSHNLVLEITHSIEFGYENLYLLITTHFPNGEIIEEPLSLELADKKGKWQSKCRRESCVLQFFLQENFKFKEKGDHSISVKQHSRKTNLEGIKGIRLELFAAE